MMLYQRKLLEATFNESHSFVSILIFNKQQFAFMSSIIALWHLLSRM